MSKRKDYLKWDEYFMGLAVMASLRSKDPNTQVGCCLVDDDNRILSLGYNGFPIGCNDDEFPWDREAKSSYDTKYNYVCHAELNAILNYKGTSLKGAKAYVNQFPCNECAKAIIQSGIKTIIYLDDKYAVTDGVKSSKRMFNAAGVKFKKFKSPNKEIVIKI